MSHKKYVGFPTLSVQEQDQITRPMALDELPRQAQIDHQMAIIRTHHERIAKAIDVFWGHKDCVEYLQKLIMNGGDGFGNARIGFRSEVMSALLRLVSLQQDELH
jgi:hypothetical protein